MGLAELLQGASPSSTAGAAEGAALGSDGSPTPAPAKPAPDEDEGLGLEESEGQKHVPLGRFIEVNKKRKEDAARAAKLEKELAAIAERQKRFEARYGKFEKPDDQMEEDATVAEAMWALRDKPEIKAALALIQQHHQGAKVSDRTQPKTEAAPAADPRVEQLVAERTRDVARGILSDAKVREQLHGPILDYVLSQNPNPTREAILSTMKEYVTAQGWTNQFLRGDGQKPKPAIVANPSGLGGGVPPKPGEKPAAAAPEKPKSLSQYEAQSRQMLHEKLAARGIER